MTTLTELRETAERLRSMTERLCGQRLLKASDETTAIDVHDFSVIQQSASAIDSLLAALEEAEKGSEWQPIKTAPKDGTPILTYSPKAVDFGYPAIRNNSFRFGAMQRSNEIFWPDTHWMPLPAPPSLSKIRGTDHE